MSFRTRFGVSPILVLTLAAGSLPFFSAEAAADTPGWQQSLRAELAQCENRSNFFKRKACAEKVHWKYCTKPGRVDLAPECRTKEQRAQAKPDKPAWVYNLRGAMAKCDSLGYFKAQVCIEKARWKYCDKRWDQAEECGRKPDKKALGDAP